MDIKALMEDIDGIRQHERVPIIRLCQVAGVTKKTYHSWVTGQSAPNLSVLSLVLDALNVDLVPIPHGLAKAKTLADSEEALWNG